MKKLNLLLFIAVLFMVSCGQQEEKITLEKIWETDQVLLTPESVLYDEANNVFYVTNVNQNPWVDDMNGSIARVSKEGNVMEVEWVKGLSGPKGMGLFDGKLFVADLDEVVEIDIGKGEITKRYMADSAKNLNDIDVHPVSGQVFISDSDKGYVYTLNEEDTSVVMWHVIDGQPKINGLFALQNALLVGGDRITKVDYVTGDQTVYIEGTGYIDGIQKVGDDKYIISDWAGTVQLVSPTDSAIILINTKADDINAADIEYIIEENLLLVPTFFDNRLVAYKLNY